VTIEEINALIARVLPMRPPKFEADTNGREKVSRLEDYLLETAYAHAELEEALHWLSKVVERCQDEIAEITGYEVALPSKPQARITRDDVIAAKRKTKPQPFLAGAEAKHLRETVLRQIGRFEFEKDVVSRAYTMISGS
jgi:hypothetical protein